MSELSEAGVCGIDGCGPAGDNRTDSVTATKNSPDVQIEVVSDAICPWCYVAKRNLDAAVAELRKDFSVDVDWLPFELNADMPKGGLDRKKTDQQSSGRGNTRSASTHTSRRLERPPVLISIMSAWNARPTPSML